MVETRNNNVRAHEPWQLVGTAAELYERYLVPSITSLWANDLVCRANPRTGERVLDVACGTGIVARTVSERMSAGRVVGLDINGGMLAVARSTSTQSRVPVEWTEASALELPFPAHAFDLVLCQLGLQFFPDPSVALKEMLRVLAPDGRLAASVYSSIENTPVAHGLADGLDRHLGLGASQIKRSEHSFTDPSQLHALATGAGFRDVSVETVTQTIRFRSPREYVRLQIAATPMAGMVAEMTTPERDAMINAITEDLQVFLGQGADIGELTSPQQAFVVLARK